MSVLKLNLQPSASVLRGFARLWLPAFVFLVGFLAWKHLGDGWALGVGGVGATLVVTSLLDDRAARMIYVALVCATYPIGLVVSHLVLALLYFGVLTPIGLITRLVGYDPMRRDISGNATSYWIKRGPSRDPKDYFRQY